MEPRIMSLLGINLSDKEHKILLKIGDKAQRIAARVTTLSTGLDEVNTPDVPDTTMAKTTDISLKLLVGYRFEPRFLAVFRLKSQ